MKLPVSNTNAPAWRDITVKSRAALAAQPLEELSKTFGGYGIAKPKLFSALSIPTHGAATARTP